MADHLVAAAQRGAFQTRAKGTHRASIPCPPEFSRLTVKGSDLKSHPRINPRERANIRWYPAGGCQVVDRADTPPAQGS